MYEGFSYRKYMTSKSMQSYWTCTLRGCKAKATMKPDGWFSLTKYTHNHEPNYEEMERKAIISEVGGGGDEKKEEKENFSNKGKL